MKNKESKLQAELIDAADTADGAEKGKRKNKGNSAEKLLHLSNFIDRMSKNDMIMKRPFHIYCRRKNKGGEKTHAEWMSIYRNFLGGA